VLKLVATYSMGVNTTAILCGLRVLGIRPDKIICADTGAEMPEAYDHLAQMRTTVREWWGLEIDVVHKLYRKRFEGIAGECERRSSLPSLAYGSRACSVKYKVQPCNLHLRRWMKAERLPRITRAIGFDSQETYRVRVSPDAWADNWYPLIEWGWDRARCLAEIQRAGVTIPGKSACFFCPASRPSQIAALGDLHPELLARALRIEAAALAHQPTGRTVTVLQQDGSTVLLSRPVPPMGLSGKNRTWANHLANVAAQSSLGLDLEPIHTPCNCTDGATGEL